MSSNPAIAFLIASVSSGIAIVTDSVLNRAIMLANPADQRQPKDPRQNEVLFGDDHLPPVPLFLRRRAPAAAMRRAPPLLSYRMKR